MRKFLAVVKREYVQRVRTKFFVVATILGPVLLAGFTVVPAMMFSIKSGGPARIAIVDQTGKMYERVAKEIATGRKQQDDSEAQDPAQPLQNKNPKEKVDQAGKMFRGSYLVENVPLNGNSIEEARKSLELRIQNRELEGYVVLPADLLKEGRAEFRERNAADVFTANYVAGAINRAVRGQRLAEKKIDEQTVAEASEPIELKTTGPGGKECSTASLFWEPSLKRRKHASPRFCFPQSDRFR